VKVISALALTLISGTQTPLKELLVFHADPEWLSDCSSLQRYIQSELNVRDVVFTSNETTSGIRYRAVADWAVLGKKLRKDLARVKTAIPDVPSGDIKEYVKTGKITVGGIGLVEGDLQVQRYIELPAGHETQFATHTDNDVVVRLDVKAYPELTSEWLVREMINRVQKLRKKGSLQATDDIEVYYKFEGGSGAEIVSAMERHAEVMQKTVRNVPIDEERRKGGETLIAEEQEVAEVKFMLSLVKP
jgi:isoleucyl-tRNA synthetase